MGLEVVTKGPFQMPYGLKLPDTLGRKSLERKIRQILPTISLNFCKHCA